MGIRNKSSAPSKFFPNISLLETVQSLIAAVQLARYDKLPLWTLNNVYEGDCEGYNDCHSFLVSQATLQNDVESCTCRGTWS